MPTLPQKIEIRLDRSGQPVDLTIDGEQFPWHIIAEQSPYDIIDAVPGQLASINIRIPARTIEIISSDGGRESFRNDD